MILRFICRVNLKLLQNPKERSQESG
uniref:Uncharacterized protein n=1 Tax=Rhizophora mucronata TaxID=61149 RepID=A0A2P2PQS2_RHIMU